MSKEFDLDDLERRMAKTIEVLHHEFAGLRTGRASPSILDPLVVDAYGSQMHINQLATINVPDPRMISIQVWDRSTVGAVEKAIRNSDLGLNPIVEGQTLRLPIPELNAERRHELTKVAHKYAEQARVAVRNVRREGMDALKKHEKEGEISQDDHKRMADDVQQLTDMMVEDIDKALATKEQEILQV